MAQYILFYFRYFIMQTTQSLTLESMRKSTSGYKSLVLYFINAKKRKWKETCMYNIDIKNSVLAANTLLCR